jgi:ADP-dependent NAD(P)H-hydrate dehydratase / NAD(P)H-hydrate epimerase
MEIAPSAVGDWPAGHRPELNAVVTAEQMRQIEAHLFAAGMPVAALMEKVAGLLSRWVQASFDVAKWPRIAVLAGPGHNGGDALSVARELHLSGYQVQIYSPFSQRKPLTEQHARYAASLGLPFVASVAELAPGAVLIDGLFGFGLTRPLSDDLAAAIAALNQLACPRISLDLPSGLHTDSGAVLGAAVEASHSLCLGLWKRAYLQEAALAYLGQPALLDVGIPAAAIAAVLGQPPSVQQLTAASAIAALPLPRPLATHKYQVGQLLLIAGSRQYGGAALLAGLGARASGAGMVTLAVPESLRHAYHQPLPEALILGCAETAAGAIARLPEDLDFSRYSAIACGPGLSAEAGRAVDQVMASDLPLLLDADGLNWLAQGDPIATLLGRSAPTLLTPHLGEFRRLFPAIAAALAAGEIDAGTAAQTAAGQSGAVVLLKGARPAIAHPQGALWYLSQSTPALARGGSGDVLTGLAGGLLAQTSAAAPADRLAATLAAAQAAAWWHAQAACAAATAQTVLGVDPLTLARSLTSTLARQLDLAQPQLPPKTRFKTS